MPSESLLYATSGGVAAVLIAYATILPELDLIAWRLSRFSFHLKAKQVACAILLLSLVMLVIDRNGAVTHSAIPGGLRPDGFTPICSDSDMRPGCDGYCGDAGKRPKPSNA